MTVYVDIFFLFCTEMIVLLISNRILVSEQRCWSWCRYFSTWLPKRDVFVHGFLKGANEFMSWFWLTSILIVYFCVRNHFILFVDICAFLIFPCYRVESIDGTLPHCTGRRFWIERCYDPVQDRILWWSLEAIILPIFSDEEIISGNELRIPLLNLKLWPTRDEFCIYLDSGGCTCIIIFYADFTW